MLSSVKVDRTGYSSVTNSLNKLYCILDIEVCVWVLIFTDLLFFSPLPGSRTA